MGREADIVVVGAGPGGIACAIAAAEGGSHVVLLEKTADIGGALPWSGGHLSAGGFSLQRARGIEDDPERHWQDIARISGGTGREDLTRLSLAEQPSVLEWLLDAGFAVDPTTPRIVHGHEQYLVPRTVHALEVPGGLALLTVLRRLLAPHLASGAVRLLCGARAAELCADPDGRVAGVRTEGGRIFGAPAVVLATGGFGHDPELFAELDNAPLTTSAAPTATGDGIRLGRSVGGRYPGPGEVPADLRRPAARARNAPRGLGAPPSARRPRTAAVGGVRGCARSALDRGGRSVHRPQGARPGPSGPDDLLDGLRCPGAAYVSAHGARLDPGGVRRGLRPAPRPAPCAGCPRPRPPGRHRTGRPGLAGGPLQRFRRSRA
ncbi:FAD-dependent oxidoreductase [Streptomyces sp. P01-B04]|nr:FAD-dependent oxidoreductase [Streptomyces poriferorum]MBW5255374.1 FAD-dependent oxidoreductase [Streptomyces poriferorum]